MADRTVRDAISRAAVQLRDGRCPTAEADAAAIVAATLACDIQALAARAYDPVPPDAQLRITDAVHRRRAAEPLAYILGRCRFRALELHVDPRVMVPLPDSGPLVDVVHRLPRGGRLHDVGTGSGALALAAKAERPDLTVTASDTSPSAITVAARNARRLALDVRFGVEPWLPAGDYDLVLAHLPYIDLAGRVVQLPREIAAHQPPRAIYASGSPDGLTVIREFLRRLPPRLRVALQHAPSQTNTVRGWLTDPRTLPSAGPYGLVTVGRAP